MWTNLLYIELVKLRRSFMIWLIPIAAIAPILLSYIPMHLNAVYDDIPFTWENLFQGELIFFNLLFAPPLFSLVASYIFAREYHDHVINQLFSYPINRMEILVSKLFISLLFIIVTVLLSFVLTIGLGSAVIGDQSYLQLYGYLKIHLYSIFMQLALVPISILIAILRRSIVYPISVVVIGIVMSGLIISKDYSVYFPWSAPTRIIYQLSGYEQISNLNLAHPIMTLLAVFAIPLAASFFSFRYLDQLSES